jgi:hypothetical protein
MNVNPMVSSIVQEIMISQSNLPVWRNELIKNQIFSPLEASNLTDKEISLLHQALLTQSLNRMSSDELMQQVEKHNLKYHLDFEEEQMRAICY